MGELRDFTFGAHVDDSEFQPTGDKLSLKVACTHFKFFIPLRYLERFKLETSNFVHWLAM